MLQFLKVTQACARPKTGNGYGTPVNPAPRGSRAVLAFNCFLFVVSTVFALLQRR
jgi:hypothetical protein